MKLKSKSILFKDLGEQEINLSNVLKHISRNDALSEEGIYKRSENLDYIKDKIIVLSGSFDSYYGIISKTDKLHWIENKQVLQVITRGKAGKIRYLDKNNYAANTNSIMLILTDKGKEIFNIKSEEDEMLLLKFLKIYLEPRFLEYSLSVDLSVFSLTEIISKIEIFEFKLDTKIKKLVELYDYLENYETKVNNILKKIDKLY